MIIVHFHLQPQFKLNYFIYFTSKLIIIIITTITSTKRATMIIKI